MVGRVFPDRVDNNYAGYRIAVWLLALIAASRVFMGANIILNTGHVAKTADRIPLDQFPPDAAQTVTAMFALLGLFHLLFAIVALLVVFRYRALVSFVYLLLLAQLIGSRLILTAHPIPRADAPPVGFTVNLVIGALLLIGFVLSLLRRASSPEASDS